MTRWCLTRAEISLVSYNFRLEDPFLIGDCEPKVQVSEVLLLSGSWGGPSMLPFAEVQGQSLFLVISNHKGGIKLEMLVWRVVARDLRKPEKLSIQFG